MTAAVLFPSLMGMMMLGGTELVYGECHRVEQTAGIVLIGCYTFLIGNTILGCVDQILGRAHESNHREYSKTYKEISVSVLIAKASVHSDGNALGNIAAATAAARRRTGYLLVNACGKNYGIDHLNYCFRKILCSAAELGGIAEAVGGR